MISFTFSRRQCVYVVLNYRMWTDNFERQIRTAIAGGL